MRVFFFLILISSQALLNAQSIFKKKLLLMGCDFEITVVSNNQQEADTFIQLAVDEIKRIEHIISSWDPESQTSAINRNAGKKAVQVSPELIELVQRSKAISRLTDGAFDISYASMDKIWKFDGSMQEMPQEETIKASVAKVGYENIIVDSEASTIFLKEEGMKLGFGGIGKGYAADRAKALLMKKGVVAGIINASGDMNTWGKNPNGKSWEVAITNPLDKKKAFGLLPINEQAVVTSGNYEKYVHFNGKRYAHIIDPRTGYPSSGILSVTVFAEKAELADALATAVFVLGIEVGLNRVNQLPKVECIIVDETGMLYQSKNIEIKSP
jgi:thiamine biosynthesis lipoprotein